MAQRLRNPGDVISGAAADPILRIVDPGRLEVLASVPAANLSRVLPGATARLAGVGAAGTVRLTVSSRSGMVAPAPGGTVPVRLTPAEPLPLAVDTPCRSTSISKSTRTRCSWRPRLLCETAAGQPCSWLPAIAPSAAR